MRYWIDHWFKWLTGRIGRGVLGISTNVVGCIYVYVFKCFDMVLNKTQLLTFKMLLINKNICVFEYIILLFPKVWKNINVWQCFCSSYFRIQHIELVAKKTRVWLILTIWIMLLFLRWCFSFCPQNVAHYIVVFTFFIII